jgi:hypothetical protein
MSQATNTDQAYDVAAYSRRAGALVLAAAAIVPLMLQTHGTCGGSRNNPGFFSDGQALFEWPHWAFVAVLLVAGLMLTRAANTPMAAAVALVVAAQLAGAGIVAQHHWRGAAGPACGYWTNQQLIKTTAIIAAVAATIAALACLQVVWATRRASPAPARSLGTPVHLASMVVGVLVAVALPFLLAVGDSAAQDRTSLGAFALLWSLPWGGALVLSAFLARPVAVAVALSVAVSAASAYPDYALVQVEHHGIALLVGLVSGLLVVTLRTLTTEGDRSAELT